MDVSTLDTAVSLEAATMSLGSLVDLDVGDVKTLHVKVLGLSIGLHVGEELHYVLAGLLGPST